MITAVLALWFLGAYMAAHYMVHTHGPSPVFAPVYILILMFWWVWVAAWVLCDVYELARRAIRKVTR